MLKYPSAGAVRETTSATRRKGAGINPAYAKQCYKYIISQVGVKINQE